MAKRLRTGTGPSDDRVRALLDHYRCPVPFHGVRTRFFGNIASPALSASPMEAVQALWGGEMPEFESVDAANELVGALVMGLWNRLTQHQDRKAPFRLTRIDLPPTPNGLARLAQIRREEIEGFAEGLFGKEASLDLPERARRSLQALSEIGAMLEGVRGLAGDPAKPATAADIVATIRSVREMTRIAEHEIHAAVLACKRARVRMLESLPTTKPVRH